MIVSYNESVSALGAFRQNVPFLPEVDEYSYENFMRMYLTKDNQFFYNLITSKIDIDGELDPAAYYTITVSTRVPWTTICYNEYRNMNLWWLILIINKIRNPLEYPAPGTVLKILFPQYVRTVLDTINQRLK